MNASPLCSRTLCFANHVLYSLLAFSYILIRLQCLIHYNRSFLAAFFCNSRSQLEPYDRTIKTDFVAFRGQVTLPVGLIPASLII